MAHASVACDRDGVPLFIGARIRVVGKPSPLGDEPGRAKPGQVYEVGWVGGFTKVGNDDGWYSHPRRFTALHERSPYVYRNERVPLVVLCDGMKNSGVQILNPELLKLTEDRLKEAAMSSKTKKAPSKKSGKREQSAAAQVRAIFAANPTKSPDDLLHQIQRKFTAHKAIQAGVAWIAGIRRAMEQAGEIKRLAPKPSSKKAPPTKAKPVAKAEPATV